MSRLADEILKHSNPAPWVKPDTFLARAMNKAGDYARKVVTYDPVIDISNVADFMWASKEEFSSIDKEQFPCLTPPFKRFWMEYRRPPIFVHQRDDLLTDEGRKKWAGKKLGGRWVESTTSDWPIERYGFLIDSVDLQAGETVADFTGTMIDTASQKAIYDSTIHPDSRWIIRIQVFIKQRGSKAEGPMILWLGGLDERGVLIQDASIGLPTDGSLDPEEKFYWTSMLVPTIQPALRAICYMHCKNIETQVQKPIAKISKKHEKRHGKPLLTFRTLVIQPLTAGGKSATGGGGGGAKSHHFRRGHFGDYREKGLFGKESMKRIFWFDMTMVGSKEVGEVIGDYEVKAP